MSMAIIGGADGPTSIFIASSTKPFPMATATLIIVVAAIIIWKIWKKKRKDKNERNI